MEVPFVLSVEGEVPVDCAREYMAALYSSFASHDLHRSKGRADTAVKTVWPTVRYHLDAPATKPWYAPWALIPR